MIPINIFLKESFINVLRSFGSIITYILFWLIYFQLLRLCFFLYQSNNLLSVDALEVLKVFWYGIHVDLCITSYIMVIPLLVITLQLFFKLEFYRSLIKYYSFIIIIVTSFISMVDMELYSNWGFKINNEVLFYLKHPKEALASSSSSPILLLILVFLFIITVSLFTFKKLIIDKLRLSINYSSLQSFKYNLLIVIILTPSIAIGMRGGLHLAPFNPSYVYFSNNPILNHSALNASWNLMQSLSKAESEFDFNYMSEVDQEKRTNSLYAINKSDTSFNILKSKRPNVVLIVLEGWTSDIIESLGGVPGVNPQFEQLVKEGLLFKNFYSSGDRTYKGIPAILSSFPALSSGSIIKHTAKMEKLPSLCSKFNESNYSTSFYYGGELSFANMKAYIQHCNFSRIVKKFDFDIPLWKETKWGVHDHHLFNQVISDLNSEQEPFFSTILTLSSHEPFTVPMETKFNGTDRSELFKNSAYYTDKSLGEFMQKAKQQDWFANTLFVFLADHGKNLPLNRKPWDPKMFKIPLLFYGEVLKEDYRNKKIEKYGVQTDLSATLLNQLGMKYEEFNWSKDLFSTNPNQFAFFNYNNGFGWANENNEIVYDFTSEYFFCSNPERDSLLVNEDLLNAKAYMQKLYETFNEL